ncbi:serine/threonine-protein kinase [Schaalia sp. lx-100]|uniref:serine/threonine-protein kinase n=1 Tax=Schaalia sp. lx-100 TaxID=2899081 RepID=UPI001E497C60|nr:serine/threonine-protein kinase [Schaalia sp. lx-100]MCD4557908.1 protein kinase [Schaalia sp. lx-100]
MTHSGSQHPTTLTGRVLAGRYTLLAHVAQGGMGEVWKARDRETGRLVAAKILKSEFSGQEISLSRLRIEASNAMRITHPNVANVYDSGEANGRGWIIMELVDGRPLTDYLANNSRIAVADLLPVLMQVAMALDAAEKAGVVHRDIKPANILVRDDGIVKLTDFGISRTHDQVNLTVDGMVMGTAQYLPPEQAMGKDATPLGDLYALGIIAYEALAGQRPYTGQSQVDIAFAHVNDPLPPLPRDIPEPIANVVLHLLEKEPERRPSSGTALARELMNAATQLHLDLQPHPLPLPENSERDMPLTASQPVVAPVRHTPHTRLPAKYLEPVDMDVQLPDVPRISSSMHFSPSGDRTRQSTTPAPHVSHEDTYSGSPGHVSSSHDLSGETVSPAAPTHTGGQLPDFRRRTVQPHPPSSEHSVHTTASDTIFPGPSSVKSQQRRHGRPSFVPTKRASSAETNPEQRHFSLPRTSRPDSTRRAANPALRAEPFMWPDTRATSHMRRTHDDTHGVQSLSTKYNRSVVSPPTPLSHRIGKWVVIALFMLTVMLVVAATIHHRLGFSTLISSTQTATMEEVRTWLSTWHAV